MLFNEPKLLKSRRLCCPRAVLISFSALQRAEIAEIRSAASSARACVSGFSALQRAEIAEIHCSKRDRSASVGRCFSALQRAEIAEMRGKRLLPVSIREVSVLFNEPKLLKSSVPVTRTRAITRFSALQRAEIAEIHNPTARSVRGYAFQCSSTSRNC